MILQKESVGRSIALKGVGVYVVELLTSALNVVMTLLHTRAIIKNTVIMNVVTIITRKGLRERIVTNGRVIMQAIQRYTNGCLAITRKMKNVSNVVVKRLLTGLIRAVDIKEIGMIGFAYVDRAIFTMTKDAKYLKDIDRWENLTGEKAKLLK